LRACGTTRYATLTEIKTPENNSHVSIITVAQQTFNPKTSRSVFRLRKLSSSKKYIDKICV
jgi:hypothetical protein